MYKFIIASFLLLGWVFYEASGGSDFEPEVQAEVEPAPAAPAAAEPVIPSSVIAAAVAAPAPLPAPVQIKPEVVALQVEEEPAKPLIEEPVVQVASLVETPQNTLAFEPERVVEPTADLRAVAGTRVNMRSGPGTSYGVIDTLPRGTEAEVLEVDATGWARIRIIGSGQIGWMAERLLTDI